MTHQLFIWHLFLILLSPGHPEDALKRDMLDKVNELRSKGCFCGRKYMPPVSPLIWNDTLYASAMDHATQMETYDFFAHYSIDGKDIGARLDAFHYPWQFAGENLGEGQRSFDEVLYEWQESRSHCRMLMNPNMAEMAVARYSNYWVQHFGKKLPPGAVRKKVISNLPK